ncbi:MAG: gamma-glutamyl-gamma-aminobutyrate hydrolase family protein [Anaerolineales bacterium]|nr:gamma-glutamyl-gamma-aminobutyrate hydrolase family protein [Anaerolineales bacterium]
MKPIIAITTYGRFEKETASPYYQHHFCLPTLYIDAVRRAGGIPFLLPPGEADLAAALAAVDGVLITGGGDVDPAEYGGNVEHPTLGGIDWERDESELKLVRMVANNGRFLPTLAICRGMQVVNVALGGSLYENIADVRPEDIHRGDDGGWTMHTVEVLPSSLLAEVVQAERVTIYSGNHQAVKVVAPGLRAAATAADGMIEAIEHTGLPWLLGVQWHPEKSAAEDPTQQRLFDELVQEAARRKVK